MSSLISKNCVQWIGLAGRQSGSYSGWLGYALLICYLLGTYWFADIVQLKPCCRLITTGRWTRSALHLHWLGRSQRRFNCSDNSNHYLDHQWIRWNITADFEFRFLNSTRFRDALKSSERCERETNKNQTVPMMRWANCKSATRHIQSMATKKNKQDYNNAVLSLYCVTYMFFRF